MNRTGGEDGALLRGLLLLGQVIDERLNGALEPHGLSLPKFSVLQHLVQAGEPLPLGVVSERLGCVKSNVTQLVDRLEAEQLVRRVPDPEDRRSVRASITGEGRQRYLAGRAALAQAESTLLQGLGGADREQLNDLLHRVGPALFTG